MHIHVLEKNGTDGLICRAGIEMQRQRADLWMQQGKERVRGRSTEKLTLPSVK